MEWKLTRDVDGQPVIDQIHHDPDVDLAVRFTLLEQLAKDPASKMERLAPGVYYQSKI